MPGASRSWKAVTGCLTAHHANGSIERPCASRNRDAHLIGFSRATASGAPEVLGVDCDGYVRQIHDDLYSQQGDCRPIRRVDPEFLNPWDAEKQTTARSQRPSGLSG